MAIPTEFVCLWPALAELLPVDDGSVSIGFRYKMACRLFAKRSSIKTLTRWTGLRAYKSKGRCRRVVVGFKRPLLPGTLTPCRLNPGALSTWHFHQPEKVHVFLYSGNERVANCACYICLACRGVLPGVPTTEREQTVYFLARRPSDCGHRRIS